MPTNVRRLSLWADAFRRARVGRTVAVNVALAAGERVTVSSVDLGTEAIGAPVDAVVGASERVNGVWRVRLRFAQATPTSSGR
jgi:hypothetical protein